MIISNDQFKMNKITNTLTVDKFMADFHLRQPGITYIACGPFTEHRKRNQKIK